LFLAYDPKPEKSTLSKCQIHDPQPEERQGEAGEERESAVIG